MVKILSQHRFSSIQEFQLLPQHKLGRGSFGTVFLARHKATTRMYAIKMINLKDLPSETEVKLVQREVRLHGEMDHPHIARLWETLLEGDLLYLIMEYAEKGNLFYHQNSKRVFPQPEAFKYFAQALQAILFLHAKNIVHRDIKPQNLLLDENCNIKLCDFGWSAQQKTLKRSTFCGTYEYMAPEMLFKGEYDYRIDIWALGILLYEMLHGRAPFRGKSAEEVREAMEDGTYIFSEHVSQQGKSLITGILQFNPEKRLKGEDILSHPWFKNMETYVNNRLILDNIASDKQIHDKILKLGSNVTSKPIKLDTGKHRKNISMNLQQLGSLTEGSSFQQYLKINKPKKYNSQDKNIDDFMTRMQQKGSINKIFIDNTNKMFYDGYPIHKKSKEKNKITKLGRRDQNTHMSANNNQPPRKKGKMRNSQVQDISEKWEKPVRFNTEMHENEDIEPPKLKKSNIKNKIITNSKSSTLKVGKSVGKEYLIA